MARSQQCPIKTTVRMTNLLRLPIAQGQDGPGWGVSADVPKAQWGSGLSSGIQQGQNTGTPEQGHRAGRDHLADPPGLPICVLTGTSRQPQRALGFLSKRKTTAPVRGEPFRGTSNSSPQKHGHVGCECGRAPPDTSLTRLGDCSPPAVTHRKIQTGHICLQNRANVKVHVFHVALHLHKEPEA